MNKLELTPQKTTEKDVINIHKALGKLKLKVDKEELRSKELGKSTVNAIKNFQKKHELNDTGELDVQTVSLINEELVDSHYSLNKTRAAKLHDSLERLGFTINTDEKKLRHVDTSTRKALASFSEEVGISTVEGRLTEELVDKLSEEVIKKKFTTKTQIGKLHKQLNIVSKIGKLNVTLDEAELKDKKLGNSTTQAIESFQKKYNLKPTGKLDPSTLVRLDSVAHSKRIPLKIIAKPANQELKSIAPNLRLNKVSPKVTELQKALARMGYPIALKEYNTNTFGKTTLKAVESFQKSRGLVVDGKVEKKTTKALNYEIGKLNPDTLITAARTYRVKGSVRDELLNRTGNMVIKVFERRLDGTNSQPLATKKTHRSGFFDLTYTAPIDSLTGKVKENFHLDIQLFDNADQRIETPHQIKYNVAKIQWVNFNLADEPYRGTPVYFSLLAELAKKLDGTSLAAISETKNNPQITLLSKETGIPKETVMRMVFSKLVSAHLDHAEISPEIVFGFIKQNFPPRLPGNLLEAVLLWEQIDVVVEDASTGLAFSESETIGELIDSAIQSNLVSLSVKKNRQKIIDALGEIKNTFTLEKPILVGNGTLKSVLDESSVNEAQYTAISSAFITHNGTSTEFWDELKAQNINANDLEDLKSTFDVALVTKSHRPVITAIKTIIADPANNTFKQASDVAKLNVDEWVQIVKENGGTVPDNMPGDNLTEQIKNYAISLELNAERLFPTISAVARIKQKGNHSLSKIDEIGTFVDDHQDLDFKHSNLDKYLLDESINLDETLKEELKIVQRVLKNAIDSDSTAAMVSESLHSSYQVYSTGKNRLIGKLRKYGIPKIRATRIFENAKMRYAQVLARFVEFRPEFNRDIPNAIQRYKFDSKEIEDLIGDFPNLEALFGGMDSCECKHCQSLYGPAAYFVDLLRFLGEHDSLITQEGDTLSVQAILLDRRPDLGNIKLNCQNAHTAMPFIDLVCEILENNIDPQLKDFSHQTTLGTEELEAIPQYTRSHAYEVLANANYPMDNSFNLWQEEIRLNLEHFKIPRWELIEVFQNTKDKDGDGLLDEESGNGIEADAANLKPSKIDIAAEYLGISTHELDIITTEAPTTFLRDLYWGLDTTQTTVSVDQFLDRTKLTYNELLALLMITFVNDSSAASPLEIQRPSTTCDLSLQTVENLTEERFDLIHRFLRLWRRTSWEMWELDVLLDNSKVGKKKIDENALTQLKLFKQLQKKLGLSTEVLISFYGDIITKTRVQPDQPNITIPSLYEKHFLNLTITNPTDPNFEVASLNGSVALTTDADKGYSPVPTILSALAISQESFNELVNNTDGTLTLESLSTLFRFSYLAKGLKESVLDLSRFYRATGTRDPFLYPETTLKLIEQLELLKESGLDFLAIEYILHFDENSAYGLRQETLEQYLESLRNALEQIQELIELLNISDNQRAVIDAVDPAALAGATKSDALTAIAALKTTLGELSENFTNAAFAVEELSYIVAFKDTEAFSVDLLIQMIEALQSQITDVFDNGKNQIISLISGIFSLGEMETEVILSNINAPDTTKFLIDVLSDKDIIAKDADGNYNDLSVANFEDHFNSLHLIHKISVLHDKITWTPEQLEWFIKHHADVYTLDYGSLPVKRGMPDASFTHWIHLYEFYRFGKNYPEPEDATLIQILKAAIDSTSDKSEMLSSIATLTQWDLKNVTALDAGFGLQHSAADLDYTKASVYTRLVRAMKQVKLVGIDAATLFAWTERNDLDKQKQIALQTKYAIKSKYDSRAWLDKITPIQNALRTRKRASLVAYHLDHSQRNQKAKVELDGKHILNPLYWKDANAMYKYFLIDVEMGPDQLTSRLKQAISSVQFFVQRCFLNLEQLYVQVSQEEKENVASENSWRQWKWMKNYRIWEANRKVFFYPENWIEPELRDDKSSFFKELEDEIMQGEMTHDNAETAFLNYLHKVDKVANLEVSGLYHEYESLSDENDGLEINNVHVLARTKDNPSEYYCRVFDMNYSTWSAWEKIDVDINGDHAVPVVYNRKLHIFWLAFIEKPQRVSKVPAAKATSGPSDAPEAQKMLEIQLGWTVKKHTGWTPKTMSKMKIIHPWERPTFSYHLKPFYKSRSNELWLDLYITTSKEFNETKFYDPYWSNSNAKFAKATHVPYNETFRPWHSSSFIFNGKVKEVKMNALSGKYRLLSGEKPTRMHLSNTDSVTYIQTNFSDGGRTINRFGPFDDGPKLELPTGMHYHNNHLRNNKHDYADNSHLNVLENGNTRTLLRSANKPFELTIDHQDIPFDTLYTEHPFFYQDAQRALFIKPEWLEFFDEYSNPIFRMREYEISAFYHPYTTLFLRELNRDGIDGLLTRKIQINPASFPPVNNFNFSKEYQPHLYTMVKVDENVSKDVVDFSFSGAYAIYNWEIFFHAPLLIANRLMQNQRFEEAMRWFHYIFDPTNVDALASPQRYWITKPFYEHNEEAYRAQRIENILNKLDKEYKDQVIAWKNNPFKPHLIARHRPVAYQKNVVMKYLDNLIAWGDQLFRRDTMESINEAALLYMLAHEILGERPAKVPNVEHEDLTFNELPPLDAIGNTRVDILIEDTLLPIRVVGASEGTEPLPTLLMAADKKDSKGTLYFGIPGNDFMLKYWDTVEDRMFKIRNSMNIEGMKRSLALFAPPIDPALLVKAAAAGIDLSTVLNDISAGTPHYRFRIMLQKAVEFCSDVKQLGDKLLSALEKKDAELLSQLRSQHEVQLLKGIKLIKEQQVNEAVETLGGLQQSKLSAEAKKEYYGNKEYMNMTETIGYRLNRASTVLDAAIATGYILSGGLKLIPQFLIGAAGFGGTPEAAGETGGRSFGGSAEDAVKTMSSIATALQKSAGLANTQGGYQRRMDDWNFQRDQAAIEMEQIQFQINAAMIRQAIAERDLVNQEEQIGNSEAVYDYMKTKYTNNQLYNWMISQISTTYFQSYQLAYEIAKKAEKCYQHELGLENTSFIQFGYWDSLKKGLLSGDKLLYDLRKLEASYLDLNKRELEITKHISMVQVAPLSLIHLKQNGECTLQLPEWLFDMDYPGHYMRRIKSVSISIPCVTGPYTSINCTVSLTRHEMRINALLDAEKKYEKQGAEDDRFRTKFGAVTSIATSHGQGDNGMFELSFNDERYLPFEGAGLDSKWSISMPAKNNHFDFSTISDVIIHVNYTARNGGDSLAEAAKTYLDTITPTNSYRLFSLKHEFPNAWHSMLHPPTGEEQVFKTQLSLEHYSYFLRSKLNTWKIQKILWYIQSKLGEDSISITDVKVDNDPLPEPIVGPEKIEGSHHWEQDLSADPAAPTGTFQFKLGKPSSGDFQSLESDDVQNIFMVVHLG